MRSKAITKGFICMLLLACNMCLFSQMEGESAVTSIHLKKPGTPGTMREGKDMAPPIIRIFSPVPDSARTVRTAAASSYIIGRLNDRSDIGSLTINDSVVAVDAYGFFQRVYPLAHGLNVFKLEACDAASNCVTDFLTMIRVEDQQENAVKEESDYPGEYYGLIIAINQYSDPSLSDLDHPITDASFLYSTLLGNYSFQPENITLFRDAIRADIIRALDKLSNQLSPRDNLLLLYAGHGHWDEIRQTGYWLPADAEQSSSVNWIRNSTIQDYLEDINTRHTLLITDACFAGSIFKTRGTFEDASLAVNKLYTLSSRKAMTSGTLQEVPDKSVFIEYFLKRLLENEKNTFRAGNSSTAFGKQCSITVPTSPSTV